MRSEKRETVRSPQPMQLLVHIFFHLATRKALVGFWEREGYGGPCDVTSLSLSLVLL